MARIDPSRRGEEGIIETRGRVGESGKYQNCSTRVGSSRHSTPVADMLSLYYMFKLI